MHYLRVIIADITTPFREWTLKCVGIFAAFVAVATLVVVSAMIVSMVPWCCCTLA